MLAFCAHGYAEVRLPNGEYTTTVQDLKVKVLGGYVTIARSWTNGRWYINPDWADLKFTFDSNGGSGGAMSRTCWIVAIATPGVRRTRSSAARSSPMRIAVRRISRVPQIEKCDWRNVDAVIPSKPP